mmetsp:Transcript_33132/g.85256  ORF Transcript_33132/g.85256 Transcript_33132/m.85256 type:complete len:261 (-) Transcript_33132:380-1162(-)
MSGNNTLLPQQYVIYDGNPATVLIVLNAALVPPFFILATFVFSGASRLTGFILGYCLLLFGMLMTFLNLYHAIAKLGTPGNAIVGLAWTIPSIIAGIAHRWIMARELSQKWLIGLQIYRNIGGVFLIEMAGGFVPAIFAYPAGLGDIAVGVTALIIVIVYRNKDHIPPAVIIVVLVMGIADFLSAFFFGFFSSESPVQIFFPPQRSQLIEFPTGLIPLYLVPIAIFFHTLSAMNLHKYDLKRAEKTIVVKDARSKQLLPA